MAFHGVFARRVPFEDEEQDDLNQFGAGFSRSGRQLLPEEARQQQTGTSFGSAGPVQDPRVANPRSPEALAENASVNLIKFGNKVVEASKLPNGPIAVREGSPLRQQLDRAAAVYGGVLEKIGQDPGIAERIKGNFIAKIPIVASKLVKTKQGERITSVDQTAPVGETETEVVAESPPKPVKPTAPTRESKLLAEAEVAEKAGNTDDAELLRSAAEGKKSTFEGILLDIANGKTPTPGQQKVIDIMDRSDPFRIIMRKLQGNRRKGTLVTFSWCKTEMRLN